MNTNRQIGKVDSEGLFAENPVFSLADFARRAELPTAKALERLKYHLRRGRIVALERGLYAAVPRGTLRESFQPDRYLVAAATRPDAIFSHHAALELLGAAHSDWNVCTVFTRRRRRKLILKRVELEFLTHPTALRKKGLEELATRQVERQGSLLRVTGPERTLVDGFRQPRWVGGLAELVESASGFGVLDLQLLKRVLEAYGQRSLWAAAGWFLERYQGTFFVPDDYLKLLEERCPRSTHYIPRSERAGLFVPRWNLVLPANVVRGGEPDETE
jgi:predicted transcriptional regulator of viral defense system